MNSVSVIGNLTKDPELRHTQSGHAVCNMRIAVNDRRKVNDEWTDVPGFYDVTVWGKQGENCAQYLAKGSRVGVNGKLTWREWETQEGQKRQQVGIEANLGGVDFLTSKNGDGAASSSREEAPPFEDDIPF